MIYWVMEKLNKIPTAISDNYKDVQPYSGIMIFFNATGNAHYVLLGFGNASFSPPFHLPFILSNISVVYIRPKIFSILFQMESSKCLPISGKHFFPNRHHKSHSSINHSPYSRVTTALAVYKMQGAWLSLELYKREGL